YGARRGNHEVMVRGTFANVRIKNLMLGGKEGGLTRYKGEEMPIYDAAMRYIADATPTVVFGGEEYGTGSSRDWAAKGTQLLGVKAVIARSFERIHRSNLVGMGVLPLQFTGTDSAPSLGLKGDETVDVVGLDEIRPQQELKLRITYADGRVNEIAVRSRIDTPIEVDYYNHGGILPFVLHLRVGRRAPFDQRVGLAPHHLGSPFHHHAGRPAHHPVRAVAGDVHVAHLRHEAREILEMRPEVEHFLDRHLHADGLLHLNAVLGAGEAEKRAEVEIGNGTREERRAAKAGENATAHQQPERQRADQHARRRRPVGLK